MELQKIAISLKLVIMAFIMLVSVITSKNYNENSFHDVISILTSIKDIIKN